MRLFFISILLVSLSACQSSPIRAFSKIKTGMEKPEVLDIMGTPWTTTRLHGKDRWIYVIYDDGVRYEKEVHFLNGAAVYVGDTWKPAPEKVAETQDLQNDKAESEFKAAAVKAREENKNAYADYEKEVRGEGKKVKYMPEFEEIK